MDGEVIKSENSKATTAYLSRGR